MSDVDNSADPFSNINFEDFKSDQKSSSPSKDVDEKAIRRLAEENNFKSREGTKKKERITTKSFSLFPSEQDIINKAIKNSIDKHGKTSSGSDIIRAALHAFALLNPEEQDNLVQKHKGRGRKSY
tara:strand:+ start:36363 stop:36737 length:375 start_codon:yes stop_codon:yes gene_type:complete